jgi:glycosyltransferase involved in cell wall biosynthesis
MAERLSTFRKGTIIIFCKFIGVPTILHLHAAQFPIFYNSSPRCLKFLIRLFFKFPRKVIVLGCSAQKFIIDDLHVDDKKIEVVTNGVPAAIFPRRKFNKSKKFEALFIGNLSERKGVSDLLEAIARNVLAGDNNFNLRLAGGGDLQYYKNQASKYGLDAYTTFEGWVDQQVASHLLANADVLILPSYDEGLPLVILEAMANGVAVICTPVGEIPHFIKSEINAIFVAPGNVIGISDAISRMQSDSAFRREMEIRNSKDFDAFFSVEKFYQVIVKVYDDAFKSGLFKN